MKCFFVPYDNKVEVVPDNIPLHEFLHDRYHLNVKANDLFYEPFTFCRCVYVYRVRILSSLNTFLYFIGNNKTCVYDIPEIMKEKNLCVSKLG